MSYTNWSSSEKKQFAKRFSNNEVLSYRKGKRNGWLDCYHTKVKNGKKLSNYTERRHYSKEQCNSIFDDPANYEF